MKRITIKYFASIREAVGQGSELVNSQAANVAQLRAELLARGGAYAEVLAASKAVRVAVNQTMSDDCAELVEGAEVAFFPPVTGG